ncbi:AAA-like domain-containing protein [Gloeothece citriformis]|nr:AAA-like domain-containing protein [Gloeothece citriformis]
MLLLSQTTQSLGCTVFSMINIDDLLNFAEMIIYTHAGKHLNDLQRVILQESLLRTKKTYEQIAHEYGYSENYIQQVVATKLWRLLSDALGEKVTKANLRSVLERNYKTYKLQTDEIHPQKQLHYRVKEQGTIYQLILKKKIFIIYPEGESSINLVQTLVSALSISDYEFLLKTWASFLKIDQGSQTLEQEVMSCESVIMLLSEECLTRHSLIQTLTRTFTNSPTEGEHKPTIMSILLGGFSDRVIREQLENEFTQIPIWEWSDSSDTSTVIQNIRDYLKINHDHLPPEQLNELPQITPGVDVSAIEPIEEDYPVPFIEPELPKGSVPLNSPFYVERNPHESRCYHEISKPGAMISLKAPKQMGKTSLLNRILAYGASQNYQTVLIDFQQADEGILTDVNKLLRWFCGSISRQLQLESKLNTYWDQDLGSKLSCTLYFQEYLLEQIQQPLILALEEVNKIFDKFEVANTLLLLLRSWSENSKVNAVWQKLRLVVVHSTEEYIALQINQSPFNFGLEIDLPPLRAFQVQQLAKRHELDLGAKEIDQIMDLIAGHPYLVRLTLYDLATRKLSLQELIQDAATDTGIYKDHLHRLLWQLQQYPDLMAAFKEVVDSTKPVTLEQVQGFKLKSMGLVCLHNNQVTISCQLYQRYFSERLLS